MTRTVHHGPGTRAASGALSERPCASVGRVDYTSTQLVCRLVHCTLRRRANTIDADPSERTECLFLQRGLAPPVLLVQSGRPSSRGRSGGQYGSEGALRPFCLGNLCAPSSQGTDPAHELSARHHLKPAVQCS